MNMVNQRLVNSLLNDSDISLGNRILLRMLGYCSRNTKAVKENAATVELVKETYTKDKNKKYGGTPYAVLNENGDAHRPETDEIKKREIARLLKAGTPISTIARQVKVSRGTCYKILKTLTI